MNNAKCCHIKVELNRHLEHKSSRLFKGWVPEQLSSIWPFSLIKTKQYLNISDEVGLHSNWTTFLSRKSNYCESELRFYLFSPFTYPPPYFFSHYSFFSFNFFIIRFTFSRSLSLAQPQPFSTLFLHSLHLPFYRTVFSLQNYNTVIAK